MATVPVLTPALAGPVAALAQRAVATTPQTPLRSLSGKADPDVVRTIEDLHRRLTAAEAATGTLAQGLVTATAPAAVAATASVGGATNQAVAAALTSAAGGSGASGTGGGTPGLPGPPGPPGPPGIGLDGDDGEDGWIIPWP